MFFNALFIDNLLKTTFGILQPQCQAEETTQYDEAMQAYIARGGNPPSDYAPPLVREELNHTLTFEDNMLPLLVVSVGLLTAYGLSRAADYYQSRKTLLTSTIYNVKTDDINSENDAPASLPSNRFT